MVYGTLIIAAGGQLTLQNWSQFGNAGTIIVHGTLINRTTYEGYTIGSLTIYGSVINRSGVDMESWATRQLLPLTVVPFYEMKRAC